MRRAKAWAGGLLFCAGVLLAGSDGAYFPWLNFLGIGLLAVTAWLAYPKPRRTSMTVSKPMRPAPVILDVAFVELAVWMSKHRNFLN